MIPLLTIIMYFLLMLGTIQLKGQHNLRITRILWICVNILAQHVLGLIF